MLKGYFSATSSGQPVKMFKGVVDKESLAESDYSDVVRKGLSVSETRNEIRKGPTGISTVSRTLNVCSFRNAVNYKFRLMDDGDVRAFE